MTGDGARFCGACGTAVDPSGDVSAEIAAEIPAEDQEPDLWLGRVVDGRYRVLSRLGSGGMGAVYRVEHLQLGKFAAMKVLHPDGAKRKEVVRRFHLEAQAVSQLNHPNIVQTFDFGEWDGSLYLIMEYVKGEDLGAVIAREGPMQVPRAARLFIQVCSALTDAHDAGIIHRDLKPENLMSIRRRDGSEHAKVLDFGLAKLREQGDSAAITLGGAVLGTPYYMSPEQVRAEPLDPRADVYSLGATLYRVITGYPPFQAASPIAVLSKHLTDQLIPPGIRAPELRLPPEIDRIVMRAMAKVPADRYGSAVAVQADLEMAFAVPSTSFRSDGGAPLIDSARHEAARADTHAPAKPEGRPAPKAEAKPVPKPAPKAGPRPGPQTARAQTALTQEAATVSLESDLGDGEHRLRRRDLDEFEDSLRRRKVVSRLIVPVALLGLLAGGATFYHRTSSPRAVTVEREPNNTAGYANAIASDIAVTGGVGPALEGGRPDLDYFQLPAGRGIRAVSARLEGIPDVDLILELFDAQGRRIAKADARGAGGGEWLQPTSLGPAGGYLLVRQEWVEGTPPIENARDLYVLTAHWGAPEAGWEIEPNDWEAAATPIPVGRAVHGYLGRDDDKDWFWFTPDADGVLVGRVRPPAGVDVVLLTSGAEKPIDAEGPGREESFSLSAHAGQPVLIGVMRKPWEPGKDPKVEGVPALEESYELRADLTPNP